MFDILIYEMKFFEKKLHIHVMFFLVEFFYANTYLSSFLVDLFFVVLKNYFLLRNF
jgi:hypothetical protein